MVGLEKNPYRREAVGRMHHRYTYEEENVLSAEA
jgi:hypothetical protein